jgi:hypothetical protein
MQHYWHMNSCTLWHRLPTEELNLVSGANYHAQTCITSCTWFAFSVCLFCLVHGDLCCVWFELGLNVCVLILVSALFECCPRWRLVPVWMGLAYRLVWTVCESGLALINSLIAEFMPLAAMSSYSHKTNTEQLSCPVCRCSGKASSSLSHLSLHVLNFACWGFDGHSWCWVPALTDCGFALCAALTTMLTPSVGYCLDNS